MPNPFFRQQRPSADWQIVVNRQAVIMQILDSARRHRVAHFQIVAFKDTFVFFIKFAFIDTADEVVIGAGAFAFGSNEVNKSGQGCSAGF